MQLGLTKEQLEFRRHAIGGSDANIIMSGDSDRITSLWKIKRGEAEPEDLSGVLPVQMGSFTEPFNRYWFMKQAGLDVDCVGEERLSFDHSFMACTLDGMTRGGSVVWEAKHVSAFAKEDEIKARYMPQLHHNMIVCGVQKAILSVLYGTLKYSFYEVERDPFYEVALIEAETNFWDCVKTGDSPGAAPVVAAPVEAIRMVDMTGNNAWASAAADWVENKAATKKFEDAASALKELVEADAIEAFGHGIVITRNKAGSLSIKARK